MINLIKKDIRLFFFNKGYLAILLLYIPLITFIGPNDVTFAYLTSVLTFTYMNLAIVFEYEEKNKSYMLINSLPIKKSTIVFSKYVYAIISFIFSIIFSYIYFKILYTLGLDTDFKLSINNFNQILSTTVVLTSLVLPIYFAFNYKIANFLSMMTYIFNITFSEEVENILSKFSLINTNIISSFLLLLMIFFLSLVLSKFIYNKRNFS